MHLARAVRPQCFNYGFPQVFVFLREISPELYKAPVEQPTHFQKREGKKEGRKAFLRPFVFVPITEHIEYDSLSYCSPPAHPPQVS